MAVHPVTSCEKLLDHLPEIFDRNLTACPVCGSVIEQDWCGYEDEEGNLPVPVEPVDRAGCQAACDVSP